MYWFETVVDVRYGSFQDYIRCIVQKPVLVHPSKLVFHDAVFPVGRFVIGMLVFGIIVLEELFFVGFVTQGVLFFLQVIIDVQTKIRKFLGGAFMNRVFFCRGRYLNKIN